MRTVRAAIVVPGTLAGAEAHWYDPQRWPGFVEGFAHLHSLDRSWPAAGARLVWDSTPHGRGRVVERVAEHRPGAGQALEVEDERLRGTQRVAFSAAGPGGVRVDLELAYDLKNRNPAMPVVDLLFVRRALRDALRRTLIRFQRERRGDLELT